MTRDPWPPCRDHRAPAPVDQPTACDCGAVTRHPAPTRGVPTVIVTRGKLTVAQAARPAVVADCIECGGQAIFVAEAADGTVDHRCGTGVVGPTWTLLERPRRTARERVEVFARELEAGGVLTAEQAAASLLPGPRGAEQSTRPAVA